MTEDERVRALKAQALVDDETFNEALDHVEAGLMARWKAAPLNGTDLREQCAHEYHALQSIRAQLHAWVGDLAFAVRQAERR